MSALSKRAWAKFITEAFTAKCVCSVDQYLLSKMPQTDKDAFKESAGKLGEFGRFVAERTGGFLSSVKGKLAPGTPSTMAPGTPGAASSSSGSFAPMTPIPEMRDAEMTPVPEDDPLDPRNLGVGGPVGGHPVNPYEPFAALPQELHLHARNLMSQGASAEAACRQVYDNWMDALMRDWNLAQDGINPDRDIRTEDLSLIHI